MQEERQCEERGGEGIVLHALRRVWRYGKCGVGSVV